MKTSAQLLSALTLTLALGGCSTPSAESLAQNEPWEKTNRDIFEFDVRLDHAVARPVARGYRDVVPEPVRDGIHNALTLHLDDKHHRRYQDWNRIAREAKALLVPHESAIRDGLAAAGLSDEVAFDTVRWDVVGALICAAYRDCRVPTAALRLIDVYEAGHLPVGCDGERGRVLVF